MILHIAGINHFDPMGRERLREWLKNLDYTTNGRLAFVAVEWDESQFKKAKGQRGEFGELLRQKWPGASTALIDILTQSLGYEGDTHEEVFSDVDVLWLDQGRELTPDKRGSLEEYAEGRLQIYEGTYLKGAPLPDDGLTVLSEAAWESAEKLPCAERDSKFARLIIEQIAARDGEWAIAIVGADHACDTPGSMRSILQREGQICEVRILRAE